MATKTTQPGKGKKGCLVGCLTILVIIVAFFGGLELFRRYVIVTRINKDAFKPYQLTSEITDIAEKTTLTDKGKDIFYKAEPRFVDAGDFIKFCKTVARGIEALACKAPKPYGGPFAGHTIFLLTINDPRFADHKYSAAVHELLHIVYGMLNSDEKTRINTLLNQEFVNRQDDVHLQTIRDQMKQTGRTDEDFVEELHSKFGVEYAQISQELEEYYSQYFNDRQKVVQLYFQGGFGSRMRRMDELTQQAKVLNNQLVALRDTSEVDRFNNLVRQYNAKAAEINRYYTEIQEFYALFNPDYKPPEEQQ